MSELSERERIDLRWMVRCNADNIGFLGPTIRKSGPLPELDGLVRKGLAEVRRPIIRSIMHGGYWITVAGRRALEESP